MVILRLVGRVLGEGSDENARFIPQVDGDVRVSDVRGVVGNRSWKSGNYGE